MSSPPYTEAWLTSHSNTKLYTRTYAAAEPKAVLVFVHGFCEHVGRYEHAHPKWAERGITVFAYDGRGFGRSALDKENKSKDSAYGKTSWKDQFLDIEWAIGHVKTEHEGVPVFLMGHSMVCFKYLISCDAYHCGRVVAMYLGLRLESRPRRLPKPSNCSAELSGRVL